MDTSYDAYRMLITTTIGHQLRNQKNCPIYTRIYCPDKSYSLSNHSRIACPVWPVIRKLRVNMISAVSNRGHVRFMIYSERMNQKLFMNFLKKVVISCKQKVFFITDNLPVHHGKQVANWCAERKEEIELFFIPSYSPELNPDEYLNRDLKKNVNSSKIPRTEKDLKANLLSFMRKLQKLPKRVQSYFNAKPIGYAASLSV